MQTEYRGQRITVIVAQAGIMAALVAVATFLIQIPIPATKGYLNFGDIAIFISALTFGPIVGGFAGGVGSAISDIASGYVYFSPFTLIIKGVEGIIAGLIANRLSGKRDVIAVVIGGSEMVIGYFLAEFFGLSEGWAATRRSPLQHIASYGRWNCGHRNRTFTAEKISRGMDRFNKKTVSTA